MLMGPTMTADHNVYVWFKMVWGSQFHFPSKINEWEKCHLFIGFNQLSDVQALSADFCLSIKVYFEP